MTIKDFLSYTWEKPAFAAVRGVYVRPGSTTYIRNYIPDSERRVLFPRATLDEMGIPRYSSDLSVLLNAALKSLFVKKGELGFVRIADINEKLKNESDSEVAEFLRMQGKDYCQRLSHIKPDDFSKAYDILMIFYDMILGARWHDIDTPRPGYAHYSYQREQYPFEDDSPSEHFMCSWSQGAASMLHSSAAVKKEIRALISHGNKEVSVLSMEEGKFEPHELKLVL